MSWRRQKQSKFLSTPSGWRATTTPKGGAYGSYISIHALRVEGDSVTSRMYRVFTDFYPRPPGGGRRERLRASMYFMTRFLSTPSGWRATAKSGSLRL